MAQEGQTIIEVMGIKLVIVDDATFIREVLRQTFAGTEIEVVGEAIDGIEALKIVQKKIPDVVLMDMILPYENGVEATKKILQLFPKMKIIACSSEGQEALVLQALEAGCCHFVKKPFRSKDVLHIIRQIAGRSGNNDISILDKAE